MKLWQQKPLEAQVGFGEVGYNGFLGFSSGEVEVCGAQLTECISCHGPSRIFYAAPDFDTELTVGAAINDGAPADVEADFNIYINGTLSASAAVVRPREQPRSMTLQVPANSAITLEVDPVRMDFCHSIWVKPELRAVTKREWVSPGKVIQCDLPKPNKAKLAISIVATGTYDDWLEEMLQSLHVHGNVSDAQILLFSFSPTPRTFYLCSKHHAILINCSLLQESTPFGVYKMAALAAPYVCPEAMQIYIDVDTLILGDLSPLVTSMHTLEPSSVLIARESKTNKANFYDSARRVYFLPHDSRIFNMLNFNPHDHLVNSGVYAGSSKAMMHLENMWQNLPPMAISWLLREQSVGWGEQLLFNAVLSKLNSFVIIHNRWNHQLLYEPFCADIANGFVQDKNDQCAILHFNGTAKDKYAHLRGHYLDKERVSRAPMLSLNIQEACLTMIQRHGRKWMRKTYLNTHKVPISDFNEVQSVVASVFDGHEFNSIVNVDSDLGLTASFLALSGVKVINVHAEHDGMRQEFFDLMGGVLVEDIHADPLSFVNNINADAILVSTKHSEKTIMTLCHIARLNHIPRVFVQEMHNPKCSLSGIKTRMDELGYISEWLAVDSNHPVVMVKNV